MAHKFLEPIRIGNQTVKNRVIYLAMAKIMSGFDNKISTKDITYIRSIARGGTGLIVPGAMIVDEQWPSQLPMAPGIYDDKFIPGLKLLAQAGHENGAKILFQLWHPGAVSYTPGVVPPTINDISVDEIHRIQGKFFSAARRAMEAGADGIEFQVCHTYIASQFISPLYNHRTDEYGWDTPENRSRFAVECLTGIREVIGKDKILAVKLQGFDFPEGEGPNGCDGVTPEIAAEVAPFLEKAGADLITVSAGGTLTGRDDIMTGDVHRAEGWKVPAAMKVKAAVSIPVAASGNIRHPEFVDKIMSEGIDMVGMGRGMFAEREWVNKCAEGREDELRYCISCMNCWNDNPFAADQSNCSANPFAKREGKKRALVKNGNGRVVAVIGAGPAGMEAALTLKERGFEPVVFERENRIGGNVNIAKKPPYKDKFDWMCGYYANMAKSHSLDVRLGTEATQENILALSPYAVVFASGSEVTAPPIEGLDRAEVYQSRDILDKDMELPGRKVAVIGGGITGLETALYLKARGSEVCVVDFAPMFPLDSLTGGERFMMEAKLETEHCMEKGIPLHYDSAVTKYEDGKLYLKHTQTGEESSVEADTVVLSTGVKPADGLYNALLAAGVPNVWKIGDANRCAKIVNAVQAGSKFGVGLN